MDARNWKETTLRLTNWGKYGGKIGLPREIDGSTKMRRSPARYAVPALVVSEACNGEARRRRRAMNAII